MSVLQQEQENQQPSPFGGGPLAPSTGFPAATPATPAALPAKKPPVPLPAQKTTPVRPMLGAPTGPPVPALTSLGYFGSIDDFGQRVQALVTAHQQQTGLPPTPAQVLQLAADPSHTIKDLATAPYRSPDPQVAKAQDALQQHPITPATVKYQTLSADHPWVQEGMLPLPPQLMHDLAGAVSLFTSGAAVKPLEDGGETLQQYIKQTQVGDEGNVQTGLSTFDPAVKAGVATAGAVQTVTQAQTYLKNLAPEFFSALPATGTINSDWATAIGKYQTTPAYFRQQTQQTAKNEGFGSNTAGFIAAWKQKQKALNQNPALHALLLATPIAAFGSNGHVNWDALTHKIIGNPSASFTGIVGTPFNVLANTAGLAFGELGGVINTSVADVAAVSDYIASITPKNLGGWGKTEDQARADALKVMTEDHPRVIQILSPHNQGGIASDVATAAFDVAIGLPKFTGEKLLAGDIAGFANSRYASAKLDFAYASLKQGDLGAAVKTLENGRGTEAFAAASEDGVKDGTITPAQFRQNAAELFAHGHTTIGDTVVDNSSGLLESLRTGSLPSRTRVGVKANELRQRISNVTDQFETRLRTDKQLGATNHAADFIANVRQLTARAAPVSPRDLYNDTRLPEDVYNWARVNLKDIDVAKSLRSQVVRLRAAEDTPGLVALSDKMREMFASAHPDMKVEANPMETEGPQLESELRSQLTLPRSLDTNAEKMNKKLNAVGRVHREVIISGAVPAPFPPWFVPGGGESLAWKHAIDDTGRRIIGGGGFWNKGVTPDLVDTEAAVKAHMLEHPEAIRLIGSGRSSAILSENRWINGTRGADNETFRTGEAVSKDDPTLRYDHGPSANAAGGYLRNTLASDGLRAFQRSTPDDLTPLTGMVLRSKKYRAMAHGSAENAAELKAVRAAGGDVKATELAQAQAYAEMLFKRYSEIDTAGKAAGVADPLNEALGVLVDNVGPKADHALGQWIADNKIDMPVRDGLVQQTAWDDPMQKWIGILMTANKWNRGVMFDHVFYQTVKALTDAGWKMDEALPTAVNLAKTQTIYHMLDFGNMLQVEQDYRWLSYFATKHRLYWSWVLKQARQRPGLAAAVADVRQHLDPKGNLNFTIDGHALTVPVARLLWLNSNGYPETSPIVQFLSQTAVGVAEGKGAAAPGLALNSLSSTSGNLISRQDQWLAMLGKAALVYGGVLPASSSAITGGMGPTQKLYFDEAVNKYAAFFRQTNGHWPTEAQAVKFALLHGMGQEAWRANLPLPVTWNDPTSTPPRIAALQTEYDRITDPAKKRAFLDNHPDVALRFGVSADPMVYLHNNILWDKFNQAHAQLTAERDTLYQKMLTSGYTLDTRKEMSKLSKDWAATVNQLELEDAQTWAGSSQFPAGKVDQGLVVQQGPWATQLEGDPLAAKAFIHEAFPNIGAQQLDAHTAGEIVATLHAEAKNLNALKTPAEIKAYGYLGTTGETPEQQVKDRLSNINQTLAAFDGYPKDAASEAQSLYYSKFVDPYLTERDAKTAAAALAPTATQNAVRSDLRAWKDEHDHPVIVDFKGHKIKFPSVVQIGWATLPQGTRRVALAQAVAGNWAHVASYEKTMLGVATPPSASEGWAAYATAVTNYEKTPSNPSLVAAQKTTLAKEINRDYPGFYKDYLFAAQPKVDRFERTSLYRTMPGKAWFDQHIGGPARATAAAIKANGHSTYYERYWRNYVTQEIVPFLDRQPALKAELAGYGPDFLDTLVSRGAV